MTTTTVTNPAQVYSIADTTTGDTISVVNGPVTNGFQTTEVTTASMTYILANQSEITISGSNDGDNVVLDNPNPATGLQELAILQLGPGGTINGSSSNQSTTTPDIAVPTLFFDALAIGTNRPLQTQATTINAIAGIGGAGNINIANGVSASTPLNANLQATNAAGGSITLTNAGAVNVTTNGGGINATNNIVITTTGSTADLNVGGGAQITASHGSVSTGSTIGGDLNLGDGNGQGTLQAAAGITLGVAHNVTIDANGAVINLTSGNIVLTAGGNFTMLESPGTVAGEPVIANDASSGTIQLNAGPGGTLTLDSTGAAAVESTNGFILLTGDAIVINKAVNSGTAKTVLEPASPGQAITIGGANGPGVLGLTQAELNRITAGVVQIGSSTAGPITIAAPLTNLTGTNVLTLDTAGNVSQSLFGSLAIPDLSVQSGGSVALTNSKNDVSVIAASTTGAFSFANAAGDALTVGNINGVQGITTSNAPISLTADAITLQQPINAGGQTVTLATVTGSEEIELGTGNAGGVLGITDAELGMITAGALVLESGGGNINIAGAVSHHANLGNMQLITPGAITQSAALTVADLSLESAGGIALTNSSNAFSMLAFYNASGAVGITDTGALTIGGVDSLLSSTNLGGTTAVSTTGAIFFDSGMSSAGAAAVISGTGGISDNEGDAVVDVTAPSLLLGASTGIGSASDPLETQVSTLAATTSTGGIFIANGNAAPVTLSLQLIEVTTSGDIVLTNNGTIDSTISGDNIQGPGNVTVKATGASSDINLSGQASAFSVVGMGSGLVDVEAGRDINLGGSGNNSNGAIGSFTGSIKVVAARNFTMNANANLQVEGGTGGITVTAGGALTMLTTPNNGSGAPIFLTAGGAIALTAGAGQLMTLNSTGANAVESQNGNITLTADAMFIDSGVNAGIGNVQYQPTTAGLQIGISGISVGGLELDDAELNFATATTLTVGNATAGEITLGGAISPTHITNLTLESGAGIDIDGSSIAITGTLLVEFGQNGTGAIADLGGTSITAGAVDVTGGTGNNTFIVGSTNETITGGGGIDTVVFSGTKSQYTITPAGGGFVTVAKGGTTYTLSGITFLSFSDKTISLAPPDDFNGDSKSDILLNTSNGQFVDWTMNGPQITAAQVLTSGGTPVTLPTSWNTAAIGDFNGDGKADILLQNTNGTFVDWQMNGSQIGSAQMLTSAGNPVMLPSSWNVAGTGDFNGDGKADILLQNTNGTFVDWQMNGSQIASAQMLTSMGNPVTLPSSWSVAGVGDFNGDGQDDILVHNTGGAFVDWTMNGSQITAAQGLTYQGNTVNLDASWSVVGVGDLNGDGRDDILLRNTSGTFVDWTMNGSQITAAQMITSQGNAINLDASWSVAGIGDFNNTGQDMILLHNTNGMFVEWTLNGAAAITSAQVVTSQSNPVMLSSSFQTAADPATGGGSGTQIVGAGETLTNPIIGGGMLDLQSGAMVNGIITFAAGSTGTLLDADQAPLPDTVMGFGEGADYLSFSGETNAAIASVVASAQTVNGNTLLSFPDGTSIVLAGVTHVDANVFTH